jgi:hypothetical protein
MIDFKNEECSACSKKNVYVSTEILSVDEKSSAIRKIYLFRCEEHVDTDLANSNETARQKTDTHKNS